MSYTKYRKDEDIEEIKEENRKAREEEIENTKLAEKYGREKSTIKLAKQLSKFFST